jgi:hypothetical protein
MANTASRETRKMQSLIRKMQRARRRGQTEISENISQKHFVDRAGESDRKIEDLSADEIFQEMKRRDF